MATVFEYPKHHETGDEFPKNRSGKLRIYSMQFCPYAQRARLMLERKKVEYEVININLKQKPEWFMKKNPLGEVPVLEMGEKIIVDSLVSAEYIDEVYSPEDKLVSNDPYKRAQHKMWLAAFDRVLVSLIKSAFAPTQTARDKCREDSIVGLQEFDKKLEKHPYFAGEKLGFIDYMLWPWFERNGTWIEALPVDRLPNITAWIETMKQDPIISKLISPKEYMKQYQIEFAKNTKKYDNLL